MMHLPYLWEYGGFIVTGVSQAHWMIYFMENPSRMDHLRIPFRKPPYVSENMAHEICQIKCHYVRVHTRMHVNISCCMKIERAHVRIYVAKHVRHRQDIYVFKICKNKCQNLQQTICPKICLNLCPNICQALSGCMLDNMSGYVPEYMSEYVSGYESNWILHYISECKSATCSKNWIKCQEKCPDVRIDVGMKVRIYARQHIWQNVVWHIAGGITVMTMIFVPASLEIFNWGHSTLGAAPQQYVQRVTLHLCQNMPNFAMSKSRASNKTNISNVSMYNYSYKFSGSNKNCNCCSNATLADLLQRSKFDPCGMMLSFCMISGWGTGKVARLQHALLRGVQVTDLVVNSEIEALGMPRSCLAMKFEHGQRNVNLQNMKWNCENIVDSTRGGLEVETAISESLVARWNLCWHMSKRWYTVHFWS